jgi:hypothetical protein
MIDWYTRLYPKHEKMYIPHSESYLMTVRIRITQADTFLPEFCLRAGVSEHDVTRGRGQTTYPLFLEMRRQQTTVWVTI